MSPGHTVRGESINKRAVGYMLNSALAEPNQSKVQDIQNQLSGHFGDVIWNAPKESLHITLMDWLAPPIDYGRPKDELFREIYPEYDKTLTQILDGVKAINVNFNKILAGPAAIFAVGEDDGRYATIRKKFMDSVELLPNTKLPPQIIHFTVARFTDSVPLKPIQDLLATQPINISQTVSEFRLVREEVDPMLSFKVIKQYQLGS